MNRSTEHWFDYYGNATDEERNLYMKVAEFGSMFKDMLFETEMEDEAESLAVPEVLEYFDYTWFTYRVLELDSCDGYYDHSEQVLAISDKLSQDDYEPMVLHEMIHLHEDVINEFPLYYHDILYWELYSDLKNKISNLDELILKDTSLYKSTDMYRDGGLHDILFLLKSYDLDLRKGYELGTVYGYGKREEINDEM